MIIRERDQTFVMIEQDHHAHISADIIMQWKNNLFTQDPFYESVLYAIKYHDYGWQNFDMQPFWNDEKQSPYSFIDFPVLPKIVLYEQGVNEVEKNDPYAAALCSAHYARFISSEDSVEASLYLKKEEQRREKILSSFTPEQLDLFDNHLALLQLADNLSLYICLNEPGVSKKDEHYFFQEEISFPIVIKGIRTDPVEAHWENDETVILEGLPYVEPFSIFLEKKVIKKQLIKENSLLTSYEKSDYIREEIHFQIKR